MNKQLEKELIDEIKKSTSKKWFYKLDRLFKITKIKILKYELNSQFEDVKYFDVTYKEKFNLLSPFSWIIVVYLLLENIIKATFETLVAIHEELLCSNEYSDIFKIKQNSNWEE